MKNRVSLVSAVIVLYSVCWFISCSEQEIGNHQPGVPNNPHPADGAKGVSRNAELTWECSDPDEDVLTYDLYFGKTQPPPLLNGGLTEKKYRPSYLDANTTYYWKIVSQDDAGGVTAGPVWDFTTGGPGVFLGEWGHYGSGTGEFNQPYRVAIAPSGNVYVADTYNARVQYFSPSGSYLGQWGVPGYNGGGQFFQTLDAAVAANGDVYVADLYARIQYFTSTGSFLGQWGVHGPGNGEFRYPYGVAIAPNGNIYTAEGGPGDPSLNHRVQYFTPSGGYIGKWGGYGNADGLFISPSDIAIAADGKVYVADSGNDRVQYFTSTGSYLGKWSCPDVWGLEVTPSGTVYTDSVNSQIRFYTTSGSYVGSWGEVGSGPAQFNSPRGVTVSNVSNYIYVTDSGNHRIQYFR